MKKCTIELFFAMYFFKKKYTIFYFLHLYFWHPTFVQSLQNNKTNQFLKKKPMNKPHLISVSRMCNMHKNFCMIWKEYSPAFSFLRFIHFKLLFLEHMKPQSQMSVNEIAKTQNYFHKLCSSYSFCHIQRKKN